MKNLSQEVEERERLLSQNDSNKKLEEFLYRKKEIIIKDLEMAQDSKKKHASRIWQLRMWDLSLMWVYFLVWMASDQQLSIVFILPPLILNIAFHLIEAIERTHIEFHKDAEKNITDIFMITEQDKYQAEIISYEFIEVKKEQNPRKTFQTIFKSVRGKSICIWYLFLAGVLGMLYLVLTQ